MSISRTSSTTLEEVIEAKRAASDCLETNSYSWTLTGLRSYRMVETGSWYLKVTNENPSDSSVCQVIGLVLGTRGGRRVGVDIV